MKVLDFGLAKALDQAASKRRRGRRRRRSESCPPSRRLRRGMMFGAASFLEPRRTPEQAKGRAVTRGHLGVRRGAVRDADRERPFPGEDVSETLASVLKRTRTGRGCRPTRRPRSESSLRRWPRKRSQATARFDCRRAPDRRQALAAATTRRGRCPGRGRTRSPGSATAVAWGAFAALLALLTVPSRSGRFYASSPPEIAQGRRVSKW